MTTTRTTQDRKAKATSLYKAGDFVAAAKELSIAIKSPVGKKNAVLYSQRAACYHALGRDYEGLVDSVKAIELDPTNTKAWCRKGACEHALKDYRESRKSFSEGMQYTARPSLQARCKSGMEEAERNTEAEKVNVLKAWARGRDIPFPTGSSDNYEEIKRELLEHPLAAAKPKLRLLLIPESTDAATTQHELAVAPGFSVKTQIADLLGCAFLDSMLLCSEDQLASAKGKPNGVGVDRMHTTYQAWMNNNGEGQPLNERACRLLQRPDVHGPVLVQKTTLVRKEKSEDLLCYEKIDEQDLLSEEFRNLRAEWVQLDVVDDTRRTW
ncbi:hypothetical protein C8R43DRAFT_224170 [Mycena crocata]|nr:hypothetical protein C8R43DRAFT_224170 [Mycena crocata]